MRDFSFRMMSLTFAILDLIFPRIEKRIETFGIRNGQTVVDFGCGPGRYLPGFSRLVGEGGLVYTVDVHELAIESVKQRIAKKSLSNIMPVLAKGYQTEIP